MPKLCWLCPLWNHLHAAGARGSHCEPSPAFFLEHLLETAAGHGCGKSWLCSLVLQPGLSLCPPHWKCLCTLEKSPLWSLWLSHGYLWRNCSLSCHSTGNPWSFWQPSSNRHSAASSPERLFWKSEPLSRESRAAPDPRGPPGTVYLCTRDKLAVGHPTSGLDSCSSHWPIPPTGRSTDLLVLINPFFWWLAEHQCQWLADVPVKLPLGRYVPAPSQRNPQGQLPLGTCSTGPHQTQLQPRFWHCCVALQCAGILCAGLCAVTCMLGCGGCWG